MAEAWQWWLVVGRGGLTQYREQPGRVEMENHESPTDGPSVPQDEFFPRKALWVGLMGIARLTGNERP